MGESNIIKFRGQSPLRGVCQILKIKGTVPFRVGARRILEIKGAVPVKGQV